jgi:hypothetical protein
MIRPWRNAWSELIPFLDYDLEIRKVICSTNAWGLDGGRVCDPPHGGWLPSSGSFAILAGHSWELSSGDRSSRVVVDPARSQG